MLIEMGAVKDKSVDISEVIGLTPLVGEVSPGVGDGELKYLLTVVFGLVSIDVVVLVGGDPLCRSVLDAGFVFRFRHCLQIDWELYKKRS